MEFGKVVVKSDDVPESLVYDQGNNHYYVSSYDKVGVMTVSLEEYLEARVGNYSALTSKFNKLSNSSYESLIFSTNSSLTDLTGKNLIEIQAYNEVSKNQLPYGVFRFCFHEHSVVIREFPFDETEPKLIDNGHDLSKIVEDFFAEKATNRKKKKAALLYGAPGNGKTSNLYQLRKLTKEGNFRVFFVDENVSLSYLIRFKKLLSKDNSIFILEELTERLDRNGAKEMLTFLDGEHSWDNSMTIATTNYPEKLPANIVDRPGRFDTFLEYKGPTNDQIKQIAELFNVKEGYDFLYGKDLSFDYVSFILDKSLKTGDTVSKTYQAEKDKRKRLSETFKGRIGIGD